MTLYTFSKTEKEAKIYRKNWAKAFGKFQGSIYLVPSEAEGTLVQCDPYFRISCILPATTRNMRISFFKDESRVSEVKIQTPKLLFSSLMHRKLQQYCGDTYPCICAGCYPNAHSIMCACEYCKEAQLRRSHYNNSIFYIHSLQDNSSDQIWLTPWTFTNVYNDGKICFGYQKLASNLRHANNNFWSSTFNNDARQAAFSAHCGCPNKPSHSLSGHFTRSMRHGGSCRKKIDHKCTCFCPDKAKHSLKCAKCNCICICDCCSATCSCVCNCACCRQVCYCRCECDFNEEFEIWLQGTAIRPRDHYDQTRDILGNKYLSTKNKIDGVFFSYQSELLKKISSEFHKLDTAYTNREKQQYIVGFAKAIPDNEWEITFEDGQVLLLCENEVGLI